MRLQEVAVRAGRAANHAGVPAVELPERAIHRHTEHVREHPAVAELRCAVERRVRGVERDAGGLEGGKLLVTELTVDVEPRRVVDDEQLRARAGGSDDRGDRGVDGNGDLRDAGARTEHQAVGIGLERGVPRRLEQGVEESGNVIERGVWVHFWVTGDWELDWELGTG